MAHREVRYDNKSFTISYEFINPKQHRDILILHGWGSNKEVMKQAFQKTLPNYRHMYIDMPGFGKSPNTHILTTYDYAKIIEKFLEALSLSPSIMIGHSFGGKVATLLKPDRLVLLSSAGIPVKKSWKVRLKIKLFKILRPLGFSALRNLFASKDVVGMNQGMYETFKNVVDEDFQLQFQNFPHQALIFWGKDDSATPLSSGEKIAKIIPSSTFYPLEGDHYFFLQHADYIAKIIQKDSHGAH